MWLEKPGGGSMPVQMQFPFACAAAGCEEVPAASAKGATMPAQTAACRLATAETFPQPEKPGRRARLRTTALLFLVLPAKLQSARRRIAKDQQDGQHEPA